jgi:hypothetical protein
MVENSKGVQVNETGEKNRKNGNGEPVKSLSQDTDEKWPQVRKTAI